MIHVVHRHSVKKVVAALVNLQLTAKRAL